MKTGARHLETLRDGRQVYIRGKLVEDVTTHPAFRNSVASAAYLYDFQSSPQNVERMTFEPSAAAGRTSRAWQLPTSYAELVARREALVASAETHFGFMGRSPDHVASCLAGMYMGIEQFEAWDAERAEALRSYYHYARENDLFLTYAIINPQADRAKPAAGQPDAFLAARLCGQDSHGITVKGAKMLATSAIMANEVLVTSIQPLAPGDEPYALSFAVPMCNNAGFNQNFGRENLVRNNIFAYNRDYQWTRNRTDQPISFNLERNIVYFAEGELLGNNWKDGLKMDHNIYWDTRGGEIRPAGKSWQEWRALGLDTHSVIADPQFVNADNFDFRLKPGSPALKQGFEQIDMKTVGPRGTAGPAGL